MFYAMTFFVDLDDPDEMEEWDCSTCKGYEAPTPFEAVKAHWDHCWLDDPATDAERFLAWLDNECYSYTFHVIGQDGSQWLISFDIVPVGVTEKTVEGSRHDVRRRVLWAEKNVLTEPCSPEHAAAYPARWEFVTEEQAAKAKETDPDASGSGWWICDFEGKAVIHETA